MVRTEQDILKVFEWIDEPFLTAAELAEELSISRQAANYRLKQMHEDGLVCRKETGARSVGWWVEVAPRLSSETKRRVESTDREGAISLDDLEAEFNDEDA